MGGADDGPGPWSWAGLGGAYGEPRRWSWAGSDVSGDGTVARRLEGAPAGLRVRSGLATHRRASAALGSWSNRRAPAALPKRRRAATPPYRSGRPEASTGGHLSKGAGGNTKKRPEAVPATTPASSGSPRRVVDARHVCGPPRSDGRVRVVRVLGGGGVAGLGSGERMGSWSRGAWWASAWHDAHRTRSRSARVARGVWSLLA